MMVIVFFFSANSLAIWSTFIAFISIFYSSLCELIKKTDSFYSLIKPCPMKAKMKYVIKIEADFGISIPPLILEFSTWSKTLLFLIFLNLFHL